MLLFIMKCIAALIMLYITIFFEIKYYKNIK